MTTEDILRAVLARRAGTVGEGPFTPHDIRTSAARYRHRRSGLWAGVAAAVVLAVAVPTAVVGLRDDGSAPSPGRTPSPTPSTTPSATPAPTPVTDGPLSGLPTGPAPERNFLQDHVLHRDGTTRVLPGTRIVLAVGRCIGGFLLVVTDETGTCYDEQDGVRSSGETAPTMATSEDGTRTAYLMDGIMHILDDGSGGPQEQSGLVATHPDEAWPIGFLGDGSLIYTDGIGTVSRFTVAGTVQPLGLAVARAVSGPADLIAGEDERGNTRIVGPDGALRWTSEWRVYAFDPIGRYAAADFSASGGESSAIGILDARDGSVLRQVPLLENGIRGWGLPLLEPDGDLLFVGTDDRQNAAILRLTRAGRLERATPVLRPTGADQAAYTLGDF